MEKLKKKVERDPCGGNRTWFVFPMRVIAYHYITTGLTLDLFYQFTNVIQNNDSMKLRPVTVIIVKKAKINSYG